MAVDSYSERPAEHTMVCLSSSPSNARIVRTAAKMAHAFGGSFTALYVQTSRSENMSREDKIRLHNSTELARSLGADIITVSGEDIPLQIAEMARLCNVTKVVLGRSSVRRQFFWKKTLLSEKLTEIAPNLEIHIIPDASQEAPYITPGTFVREHIIPSPSDLLITAFILALSTLVGYVFHNLGFTESNIITVYIFGVLMTAGFTRGYTCSVISSILSVLLFNFFFTAPKLTLYAYSSGYPVTFVIMLVVSIMTGTLASKLKDQAKLSAQSAFRTKVLFDTSQLLQKSAREEEAIQTTIHQLMLLLKRDFVAYPEENACLGEGRVYLQPSHAGGEYSVPENKGESDSPLSFSEKEADQFDHFSFFFSNIEKESATLAFTSKDQTGALTQVHGDARCLYLPLRINSQVFGVVGVCIGPKLLDSFEQGVLVSILGECSLAIESIRNTREKEEAAVMAKNEQLRANLLRSISHDLRTPLTSISGNADQLMQSYEMLDDETRKQIFSDIYDDSRWLIDLVENLLSISRIEEGRIHFKYTSELIDDVVDEALRHINHKHSQHIIIKDYEDGLLLARLDAKLIIQVIINLVNNAIKYTPEGSTICVSTKKSGNRIYVSVTDNGPGIPDSIKDKVFDMFFTGENKIADSRRSLGLGLALCKSITSAHGSDLFLTDNQPHGCIFTFSLAAGEVNINE